MSDMVRAVSPIDLEDDRPIAVRRKRRSSVGAPKETSSVTSKTNGPRSRNQYGVETPPPTPKRLKKRVRFSDPGPRSPAPSAASSGLTPFLRRTSLSGSLPGSPSRGRRRHSTPARSIALEDLPSYEPFTGTIQFSPLREILDDRVKRRLKRNGLSEELNTIEHDKRQEYQKRRSELEKLKEELKSKDQEVQALKDELSIARQLGVVDDEATISDGESASRVQDLEAEIDRLKAELQRREEEASKETDNDFDNEYWTLAESPERDDDYGDEQSWDAIPFSLNDDYGFGGPRGTPMTPSRRKSRTPSRNSADWERSMQRSIVFGDSFPSPPTTQPNTPVANHVSGASSASTQAQMPDPEVAELQDRLVNLRNEMSRLAAKVEASSDYQHRLVAKLEPFMTTDDLHENPTYALDNAVDEVLTALTLSQNTVTESSHLFEALKAEIRTLGFPDKGLEATVSSIASQFRKARLELERLLPGEQAIGFENDKLLELLVGRVRSLIETVQKQDSAIDQYHEQELLLRQQLGARVDGMRIVQGKLQGAQDEILHLRSELEEIEESNNRLQLALSGYRNEVEKLEQLIMKIEGEHATAQTQLRDQAIAAMHEREQNIRTTLSAEQEERLAQAEGQHMIINELSARIDVLMATSQNLQTELTAVTSEKAHVVAELEGQIAELREQQVESDSERDETIAARDTRIAELQQEVDEAKKALKEAENSIVALREQSASFREEKQTLEAQVQGLQADEQDALAQMKTHLQAVLSTLSSLESKASSSGSISTSTVTTTSSLAAGEFLRPELVRKAPKRRRVDADSGVNDKEARATENERAGDAMEIC